MDRVFFASSPKAAGDLFGTRDGPHEPLTQHIHLLKEVLLHLRPTDDVATFPASKLKMRRAASISCGSTPKLPAAGSTSGR